METSEILSTLSRLKVELQKSYPILKLGIFGSVARGEQTDQSDLDIVVELSEPKMFDLIGIKQEIEERMHKKVDIVRLRKKMNHYLKKRIEKEAIYV